MVRFIRIINIVLGRLEFNVHHFIQHAALRLITYDVLSQSLDTTVRLLPQLLMSTGFRTNPQSVLQTEKPVDSFLYGLWFSITKTVDYAGATGLDDLLTWLQKWC